MRSITLILLLLLSIFIPLTQAPAEEDKVFLIDAALNLFEEDDKASDVPLIEDTQSSVMSNVEFKDAPLEEALESIALKSGFRIVIPEDLAGTITLSFPEINLFDLLTIILEPMKFAYAQERDTIRIVPQYKYYQEFGHEYPGGVRLAVLSLIHIDLEDWITKLEALKSDKGRIYLDKNAHKLFLIDVPVNLRKMEDLIRRVDVALKTEIFQLKFADINEVKGEIQSYLTEDLGILETDDRASKMVVTDTSSVLAEIADYIAKVDKRVEIRLTAQIYQIHLFESHQEGVDWEAIVSDYQKLDLLNKTEEGSKSLSVGTVTSEDFEILLDALQTVGRVTKLVETDYLTVANQEAPIDLDTRESTQEGVLKKGFKELVFVSKTIDTNDVGVQMAVMPKLKNDNKVLLTIHPQLNWSLYNHVSPRKEKLKEFVSKSQLNIPADPHEMIVIGGVNHESEVSRVQKVPFLGNLPLVGFVFRRQNQFFEKTEYVVFLKLVVLKT